MIILHFQITNLVAIRLQQKHQHCTTTMKKMRKTTTDYAIKYLHFSNLKRPLVIKVRPKAEICITFADMLTYQLQFRLKFAADNYSKYQEVRWADCQCAGYRIRALAGDIVLYSWARHFTLSMLFSTQMYKWVPANFMLGLTQRCGEGGGGKDCRPFLVMLRKLAFS